MEIADQIVLTRVVQQINYDTNLLEQNLFSSKD